MPASGIGGPCDHCGIRASCCWRRGPSTKPILCNACGSRYLVKKSLDGYVPIQQRVTITPRGSPKSTKSRTKTSIPSSPAIHKPKRAASRRHDNATWVAEPYDSEDSEVVAYVTDVSAGVSNTSSGLSNGGGGGAPHNRGRPRSSLLGETARATKVLRVTDEAQLRQLCSEAVVSKLLGPSLRLKPRKPLRPTISVVF